MALDVAVQEARQRGHGFLGSEHVLLALLSEKDPSIAGRVLVDVGVVDAVRDRLLAVMNLREELLRRREREQAQMRVMRVGERVDPEVRAELDAAFRDNTDWLRGVVHEYGWPGRSLVGEDGADAAWLLAQHSDHDPAFQRECLDLLEVAAGREDASRRNLAYLTDRVLLKERGKQIYGTQFKGPAPQPIEDPERVDELRAAAGLEPLAEYRKHFMGGLERPDPAETLVVGGVEVWINRMGPAQAAERPPATWAAPDFKPQVEVAGPLPWLPEDAKVAPAGVGMAAVTPSGWSVSWGSTPMSADAPVLVGWHDEDGVAKMAVVEVSGRPAALVESEVTGTRYLVQPISPERGWLLGGRLPREDLLRVAASLVDAG